MFVWIDPPGTDPGWIHEIDDEPTKEAVDEIKSGYDIPDDNDDRKQAYDTKHSGDYELSVETYQAGREFWGVTVLRVLPTDLPNGVIMVGPDGKEKQE